KNYLESKNT
ncbi:hypothetical protein FOXB_16397, partial [Fusarium oxysporum f. sp. conglutinans Fo5176]